MTYNPETMSFEVGDNDVDMIYISGLPTDTNEAEIAAHFGSIGVVKFDKKQDKHKVWLYRDKATGGFKGDCTVTYEVLTRCWCSLPAVTVSCCMPSHMQQCRASVCLIFVVSLQDPFSAASAVSWFNGKNFKGGRRCSRNALTCRAPFIILRFRLSTCTRESDHSW